MSYSGTIVCDIYAENFHDKEVISSDVLKKLNERADKSKPFIESDTSTVEITTGDLWRIRFTHYYDELNSEWDFDSKGRNMVEMQVKSFINAGNLLQPIRTAYNQFSTYYQQQSFKNGMGPIHLPINYIAANGIAFHVYIDENK